MPGFQRKKNEDALLLALACGATIENAARQCGLSDRTVYRRLKDPEFLQQIKTLRADMVRRSSGMLTAAAGEAVRTLLELLKSGSPPPIRLGAARAVLEIGVKVREMTDLEADLKVLEARIHDIDQQGGPRYRR